MLIIFVLMFYIYVSKQAACHKERKISKKAVNCIHEVVTTLLGSHPELPHFHFNESFCKPFENLICLELCDGDIQDQVRIIYY